MTTPLPNLPSEGSTNWYASYAAHNAAILELQGIVNSLQGTVNALTAPTGLVLSVNGVTPNGTGDVTLGAADVGAQGAGWTPGFGDLPIGVQDVVDKDPVTGFWPSGYNTDGSAIYTGGSASHGVRPHARLSPVIWRGAEPSPDSVSSGTGGMMRATGSFGGDERAIPNP